jgi:hypothetical protein
LDKKHQRKFEGAKKEAVAVVEEDQACLLDDPDCLMCGA